MEHSHGPSRSVLCVAGPRAPEIASFLPGNAVIRLIDAVALPCDKHGSAASTNVRDAAARRTSVIERLFVAIARPMPRSDAPAALAQQGA